MLKPHLLLTAIVLLLIVGLAVYMGRQHTVSWPTGSQSDANADHTADQAEKLGRACEAAGAALHFPELSLCTDNGAMIALAAAMRMAAGLEAPRRDYRFSVLPRWDLASLAT